VVEFDVKEVSGTNVGASVRRSSCFLGSWGKKRKGSGNYAMHGEKTTAQPPHYYEAVRLGSQANVGRCYFPTRLVGHLGKARYPNVSMYSETSANESVVLGDESHQVGLENKSRTPHEGCLPVSCLALPYRMAFGRTWLRTLVFSKF
jgi:hypothetical protein